MWGQHCMERETPKHSGARVHMSSAGAKTWGTEQGRCCLQRLSLPPPSQVLGLRSLCFSPTASLKRPPQWFKPKHSFQEVTIH